jgi:arylsulfatase A-like enzyme
MKNNEKPNIVLLFTDDQRFDTINALGNPDIITPNIDKLVSRGTAFTHAHIMGGTCGAVCMPSRAMLHSGRSLFRLENSGRNIPEEHVTLAETLRVNGYQTFGTGKWHNGRQAYTRCFTAGAEIFFGGMMDHWNVPAYNFDPEGKYDSTIPRCKDPFWNKEVLQMECDHIHVGQHSTETIAGASIDFIKNYESDDPFFMYVSFLAPHDPRVMPQRYLDMYDLNKIKLPANFMGGHPFDNGELHIRDEELAAFPRNPEEIKKHIRDYYAMITHLDTHIGRIIDQLETKGVLDNTIIILAGDNGLAVGQHGLMGKQNMYEHSIRVPLVFAGPGIPQNEQRNSLVYLLDIYPTLCDIINLPPPDTLDGISLKNAIDGTKTTVRKYLYTAYTHVQRAVSNGKFKLIEYSVEGQPPHTQLFDLLNDPAELNNLAELPEYSELITAMREIMLKLARETDDNQDDFGKKFWSRRPDIGKL